MPKGQTQPLTGFGQLERLQLVAMLARKIARVVAKSPADVANEALRAAMRDEVAELCATPTAPPPTN